jgi:hypothetical protein
MLQPVKLKSRFSKIRVMPIFFAAKLVVKEDLCDMMTQKLPFGPKD